MALDDKPEVHWDGVMVNQNDGYFFWVKPQIYNWRLMTVRKGDELTCHRWWCYEGKVYASAAIVVYAAMTWDGEGDPVAWSKNGQTGVWRDKEDAVADLREIKDMDPDTLARYYAFIDELLRVKA